MNIISTAKESFGTFLCQSLVIKVKIFARSLAQIVFVMSQELGSDPHITELGNQKTESFPGKVKLSFALARLFEENRTVHVDENDKKTQWEVRNRLINLVDFFNLIAKKFENFLFAFSFRGQFVGAFLRTTNREALNLPPVLNSDNELDFTFEGHAQG